MVYKHRIIKTFNNFSINESVGVNKDVIKLSDFISEYIHNKGKKYGKYVITKKEIPADIDLPVNKITVIYGKPDRQTGGTFNPFKSKRFKSGNVELYVTLHSLKKSVIYHEVNHGLQFIKLGRGQMISNARLSLLYINYKDNFDSLRIKNFLHTMYMVNKLETGSHVVQFYGQIKGLVKQYIKVIRQKYEKKVDADQMDKIIDEFKRKYFKDTLMNRSIYRHAKFMKNLDLFKYFRNVNRDELYRLFNVIELFNRGNLDAVRVILNKKINIRDYEDTLPVKYDNIDAEIRKYQKLINKDGEDFLNKIGKVWYLIEEIK